MTVILHTAILVLAAQAQTSPYALLQYSSISASGNTVTASRVPVIKSGSVVYIDVTVQFDIDAEGKMTISAGYPQVAATPTLVPYTFVAGRYSGPVTVMGGKFLITVSGPGVSPGGTTTWSVRTRPGADPCTYPSSATWYAGPIENSPMAARLSKAGITSTAWSYGIAGSAGCSNSNSVYWQSGTLIGVSQTGNLLTIASFSRAGVDGNVPLDQITFNVVDSGAEL